MVGRLAVFVCSIGIIACTQNGAVAENPPPDTPDTPDTPGTTQPPVQSDNGLTPEQQAEWNAIEALEAQAKVLARIDGCSVSGDCRTAPVGSRGCGGPRYHIPWCARTTDSAALHAKLAQVAGAEEAYNKKHSVVSTCEMRVPPEVVSSGGSCITR